MAQRRRNHTRKPIRSGKNSLFNKKRRTKKLKKQHLTRRNRRGGMYETTNVVTGLSNVPNKSSNLYNTRFGSTEAITAAKRSNQGVPNSNPFGSRTVISTILPTMPKQ